MKSISTFLILFFSITLIDGQPVEVNYGSGYTDQIFVDLETGERENVSTDSWELAFGTGGGDFNIVLNEATPGDGTSLALFLASVSKFEDTILVDELSGPITNEETSWNAGAFNGVADTLNPFDLGWGEYDPVSHKVIGNRVFVLMLRDSSFIKLQVDSLVSSTYYFTYGSLNNSEVVSSSLNKMDFPDTRLAFYSLVDDASLDLSVPGWDLFFTRYITSLDAGPSGFIDYLVTGVLTAPGVETAQANHVSVPDVTFDAYEDSLSVELDVIGYDWKTFDMSTFQYVLPTDLAYFVRTSEGNIFKLNFIDFEGSSSGVTVLEYSDQMITADYNPSLSANDRLHLYPNPAYGSRFMEYDSPVTQRAKLQLFDVTGKRVWVLDASMQAGRNVIQIPGLELSTGLYHLQLVTEANHSSAAWIQR